MGNIFVNDPAPRNPALERTGNPSLTSGYGLGAIAEETFVRNPFSPFRHQELMEARAGTEMPETGPVDPGPIPFLELPAGPPKAQLMTPEEANNRFGIPGELSWQQSVRAGEASLLNKWKREELKRQNILGRAEPGVLPTAARLGTAFLVSAVDPLNIASAFIPVVGEARFAYLAGKLGVTGARVARGAVEGAVGAAVVEPLVYLQAQSEQADYDAYDSLLNIAFGTVLGGGLHAGFGALGDRIGRLPIETRETALRGAVAAIAEDRPVAVGEIVQAALSRMSRDEMLNTTAIARTAPVDKTADAPVIDPVVQQIDEPAQAINVQAERVPTFEEIRTAQVKSNAIQPSEREAQASIDRLSEGFDQPITPETHAEEAAELIEATDEAVQIAKREGVLSEQDETTIKGDPEMEKLAKGRAAGIEAAAACLSRVA